MSEQKLSEIMIDVDTAAEWWDAARNAADQPRGVGPLLAVDGPERILFRHADAEEIYAWGVGLLGWETGCHICRAA